MGGLFGNLVSKSESCGVQNKTKTNEEQSENKTETKQEQKPKEKEREKEVECEKEVEREVESEYDSITPNPSFNLTETNCKFKRLPVSFSCNASVVRSLPSRMRSA